MGIDPASLAIEFALGSAAVGAYGAITTGEAEAGAAHYNANIQRQNAAISRKNAEIAEQSGEAQMGIQGQKTRAGIAETAANQSASGVDVSSGSYTNVRSSERELGEMDALTIRANAAREAYGYRNKAVSEEAQGVLSDFEAKSAKKAAGINAASTLLGGASQAGSQYESWKIASGKDLLA